MTGDHKACLKSLRERPVGLESDAESEARLACLTPHLNLYSERLMRARAERGTRLRLGFGAASAMLVVSGLTWVSLRDKRASSPAPFTVLVSGEFEHEDAQGRQLLSVDGFRLTATGTLTTFEKQARVVTPEGLEFALEAQSVAALDGLAEQAGASHVRLSAGALHCKVPHLGKSRQFSVVTPDARVVVHGTEFSVQVLAADGEAPHTCVKVTEGLVSVERAGQRALLGAGHALGCETVPRAEPEATEVGEGSLPSSPTSGKVTVSTLPLETHLLKEALIAERDGNRARAKRLLKRLVAKYPQSPLRAEAQTTLARVDRNAKSADVDLPTASGTQAAPSKRLAH